VKAFKTLLPLLSIVVAMVIVISQTWQTVSHLELSSRKLVSEDLILYEQIQHIRNLLNHQQLTFHTYYLEGDAFEFQASYQDNKVNLFTELETVETVLQQSEIVAQLRENMQQLDHVATEFVNAMLPPTDWDQARTMLAEYAPLASQLDQLSLQLTHQHSQRLMQNARFTLEETEKGIMWIGAMSLMLFLAAIALLTLNKRLSKALKQLRLMANFPALNPSPVMAVTEHLQIKYANPGTRMIAREIFGNQDPTLLLPVSLKPLLQEAKKSTTTIRLEYPIKNQVFAVNAHWINELKEYHLYLADITLQHQAREKLQHTAFHHVISDLPNRQALMSKFDSNRPDYLMLLEINRFNEIISTSGHELAETVIKATAKRLVSATRGIEANLFHLESNLFAVTINEPGLPDTLVSNIFSVFAKPIAVVGRHFYLSFTIGGVLIDAEKDLFEMMRKADNALHSVTNHSGNHFRAYDDALDKVLLRKMALENDLRHAIHHQELAIYYQPIIDVRTGIVTSAEALMRWHRRRTEWVSPAEFIPVAESSGLINELGKWLIEQVFSDADDQQQKQNGDLVTFAINISAIQWQDESLVEFFTERLHRYAVTANNFTLEITEQVALQDIERTVRMLDALKVMGFKVAIDDFGTGYSSLSYLHGLPIDAIKIDKSFISSIAINNKNSTIVEMLISLAHQLHLKVVAEGVESEAQYQQLLTWNCDYIQGFLFSKPLDKKAFERFLAQHH